MATSIPLVMALQPRCVIALVAFGAYACQGPARNLAAYHFTAGERQAVASALGTHPGWRLATRADNTAPDLATVLREQPGYEPYFVRETDRAAERPDFAVALVRDGQFAVYWFRADDDGYMPGQEVTTADWLHDGGLHFRGDALEVAPFNSDEIFAFRWPPHAASPMLLPASDNPEP